MRNAIRLSFTRTADIIRKALESDLRRAVGVQIDRCSLGTQHACSKTCERSTERVTGGYDFVRGVLSLSFLDGGEHVCLRLEPGLPEADAGLAVAADGSRRDGEVKVRQPIPN